MSRLYSPEDPWSTGESDAISSQAWQEQDILDDSDDHNVSSEHDNVAALDFVNWSNGIRSSYKALSNDIITVEEIPEKEGILFKHTNYAIQHLVPLPDSDSTNSRKVVRRYSDFVWLLEVLLMKYPFRMIPDLPPKKLASNGDSLFLERRRKGLARFMNLLMKHPVLSKEPLVLMFLTVPTDLSSWRKQAQYDSTEEFKDKKSSREFQALWEDSYLDMWDDVEKDLQTSLDRWSKLAVLIERIEVRSRQVAQDEEKFQKILQDFNTALPGMYQIDQVDVAIISDDLKIVGKHVDSTRSLIEDQCNEIVKDTTEDFKKFADVLLSMKSLFDRYRRLGGNQIEQLSKRLESNKERLQELNGKADVKGMDIDKLQEAISKDTKEIAEQTNRDWLIKETVLTEYVMFQETQFQLTKVFQEWSRTKMKYSELHSNNWGQLINALHDMPLSRHT